jgi:hypothetical protein
MRGEWRRHSDVPWLVKHELSRVEADLKRYRALLSLAVSSITADP